MLFTSKSAIQFIHFCYHCIWLKSAYIDDNRVLSRYRQKEAL